jgi:hypothetical protein
VLDVAYHANWYLIALALAVTDDRIATIPIRPSAKGNGRQCSDQAIILRNPA